MAFGLVDGVSFTAASSGTGSFVFGSSRSSFRTPAQAVTDGQLVNGQTVSYLAQDSLSAPTQREWGHGVFTSGTNTITRATILGTSAGGTSAVNFSVPPIVSLTALAEDLGTGGTVTASVPALNITQTWNNAAVTFDAPLFMNITNTASASASMLADFQIGGASVYQFVRYGQLVITGLAGFSPGFTLSLTGDSVPRAEMLCQAATNLPILQFGPGNTFSDTFLYRPAAATWQLGARDDAGGAVVAQTLQVQSVVAGTSNQAGTDWTFIGSKGTGASRGGGFVFQTAPSGVSGTAQNTPATTVRIDSTSLSGQDLVHLISATTNSNGLRINNTTLGSEWFLEVAGNTGTMGIGTGLLFYDNFSGHRALILNNGGGNVSQLLINSGMAFSWASTSSPNITDADTFLTRAGTAAIRFGLADAAAPVAQTLQVQSVAAGTANTAGADWTHQGSLSTGSGTPGQILFNTAQGTLTLSAVTVTISIASPAVITLAAHGLVPGNPVSFATTGALPTGIVAGTTYYVIAAGLASGSFEIAATPGGAAINTSGSQSGTQTISTVNTAQEGANNVLTIGRSGLVIGQSGPAVAINQTWNTSGVVDAALLVNVTNIASAAGSLLMDLQVGGATLAKIDKSGHIWLGTDNTNQGYGNLAINLSNRGDTGFWFAPSNWDINVEAGGSIPCSFRRASYSIVMSNAVPAGFAPDPSNPTVDLGFYRDSAAGIFAIADAAAPTTASGLRVYNTTDALATAAPTNYERGVFDWTTTANTLTIGTQAGGTGTARNLVITSAASIGSITFNMSSGKNPLYMNGSAANIVMPASWQGQSAVFGFNAASNDATSGSLDTGIFRSASKVLGISADTAGVTLGWLNYAGQTRVTADVTATSTTTLATATGLSVALAAGRTYSFMAELSWTDAAAGGLQLAMVGTGGLTATNIIYDGYIIDSGANGIKGNAQATALGGVVASSTTTGTAGHARVSGTITVNVAGTLNLQFAQNTSNGTATTIKRGSYMIVHDMP